MRRPRIFHRRTHHERKYQTRKRDCGDPLRVDAEQPMRRAVRAAGADIQPVQAGRPDETAAAADVI